MKYGVIPCAGSGTRMGFLSYFFPKTLLPVWERPLLHSIIENMLKLNVREIFLIVNYKKELIREYLNNTKFSENFNYEFVEQEELKGIAHAISLVENYVERDFVCILGDDFTLGNLQNLVECFYENNALVVEGVVYEKNEEVLKSTCNLKIDDKKRILEIREKPTIPFSNLRGTGVYIFSTKIFDYIRKTPVSKTRNEIEVTDTINLIAKDGKAYGEFIDGINININTIHDLFKAWKVVSESKQRFLCSQ